MKNHVIRTLTTVAFAVSGCLASLKADVITKADNTDDLNLGSSWVEGVAPGPTDIATWDAAMPAGRSYNLGDDLSWSGLAVTADPGGNLTFNAGHLLTLGADGVFTTPNRTITLRNELRLATDQTWSVGQNNFILEGQVDFDGKTLSLIGNGSKQFKSIPAGPGTIRALEGWTKFTNQGNVPSELDVEVTSVFAIEKDVVASSNRLIFQSVKLLEDARLEITGSSKGHVIVTNQNQIAITRGGQAKIRFFQQGNYHMTMQSDRLEKAPGSGSFLVTGKDLGIYDAHAQDAAVNLIFAEPPELERTDGATGPTTLGILKGASVNLDHNVLHYGQGLTTYDLDRGIRLLDFDTEYVPAITDGHVGGDNVRIVNEGDGSTTTVNTTHLTQAVTALNSLSLVVTGTAGDAGIVLSGDEDAVLRLNSGILFASQDLTGTRGESDRTGINLPLDFNGGQGFIHNARTEGISNGNGHPLVFNVSPVNDGDEGIVFAGWGSAYLQWPAPTSFNGPVIVNSGFVRITGSDNTAVIPTKLIVYGGNVQNHGNRIADDADIEVHGGTLRQKGGATNSGSGAHETYRDLLMTGGLFESGAHGTSSGTSTLRNANLAGGTWVATRGHKPTLSGSLKLSGGQLVSPATSLPVSLPL